MWLDLGCGGSPRGDVNLDLFIGEATPHTAQTIDPREIKNFIMGDAVLAPFRENSMIGVSAHHLAEHVLLPTELFAVMAFISRKWISVTVPNNPVFSEHDNHYYSWSEKSLTNLLSEYGEVVYVETRMMWWNSRRLVKLVKGIKILALKRLASHLLNRLVGLEIIVLVDVSKND